jgi:hypothetical protein
MRIHAVEPVPDLVDPIMRRVAAEPAPPRDELAARRAGTLLQGDGRRIAPVAAALVIGLIAGSLVVGGPLPRDEGGPQRAAAALDVPSEVLARASRLASFHARYRLVQTDRSTRPTTRAFALRTWLIAPDRFRLEIDERTDPRRLDAAQVPPNNLTYVGTSDASITSTYDCANGFPDCEDVTTVVTDRPPFSTASTVAADIVLPVAALGGADRLPALERGTVNGRDAVLVEVPFERAAPLFAFREATGTFRWRPFYPTDRVRLWLDRTGWFPVQIDVFPARGADRRSWAQRAGVAHDRPGESILSLSLLSNGTEVDPARFDVEPRGDRSSEAAHRVRTEELGGLVSFGVDDVAAAAGLDPYRAASAPAGPTGDGRQIVVAYSRGLSWLTVAQTDDWSGPGLFGDVDPLDAELVGLHDGGVAYFEAGTDEIGRRLAIHTDAADLVLTTNLPRERLLDAAASIGTDGRPAPQDWLDLPRLRPDRAIAGLGPGVELLPLDALPAGYGVTGAAASGAEGVTLFYRPRDPLDGPAIDVTIEPGTTLPPALLDARRVGSLGARYTPSLGLLEWVEGSTRYSVSAPGEPLERLVGLARAFAQGGLG